MSSGPAADGGAESQAASSSTISIVPPTNIADAHTESTRITDGHRIEISRDRPNAHYTASVLPATDNYANGYITISVGRNAEEVEMEEKEKDEKQQEDANDDHIEQYCDNHNEDDLKLETIEDDEFNEPPIMTADTVIGGLKSILTTTTNHGHRPSMSISRSGINSTLRRLPSDAHRTLSSLPSGVMFLMFSHLTSRELCRVARTNKSFSVLSSSNVLWNIRCGFMQHADLVRDSNSSDILTQLQSIKQYKNRFLTYRLWKLDLIETQFAEKKKVLRQKKLMCCLHCADGPLFLFILGMLLVIGLTLTTRHFDETHADTLNVSSSIPYFVGVGFVLLLVGCYCCARIDRSRNRCCHPNVYSDENGDGLVRMIMLNIFHDSLPQLIVVGIMFLLVCVWVVLIILRFVQVITWSYPLIFLPLFINFFSLACMCLHPMAWNYRWIDRIQVYVASWCLLIGPLCIFTILISMRLEQGIIIQTGNSTSFSWMFIMIPLFLINCYVCVATLGLSLDDRSGWPFLGGMCMWAPLLAFEVLIANWLDNGGWGDETDSPAPGPRFSVVFVPLWISLSLCMVMAVMVCVFNRPETTRFSVWRESDPVRDPLLL